MSLNKLEPIVRSDLHHEVISRIVDLLIDLESGSRLPSERELGEQLRVGRSTIREALRALACMGAVEVRRGDGIYAGSIDESILKKLVQLGLVLRKTRWKDVIEVRRLLESQAVMIASTRWNDEDMGDLTRISDQLSRFIGAQAVSSPDASRLDLEFHLAVSAATHNEMLVFLVQSIRGLLETWIKKGFAGGRLQIEEIVSEHNSILGAMQDRDPTLAARVMGEHIDKSSERLLGDLDRDQLIVQSALLEGV